MTYIYVCVEARIEVTRYMEMKPERFAISKCCVQYVVITYLPTFTIVYIPICRDQFSVAKPYRARACVSYT